MPIRCKACAGPAAVSFRLASLGQAVRNQIQDRKFVARRKAKGSAVILAAFGLCVEHAGADQRGCFWSSPSSASTAASVAAVRIPPCALASLAPISWLPLRTVRAPRSSRGQNHRVILAQCQADGDLGNFGAARGLNLAGFNAASALYICCWARAGTSENRLVPPPLS